VTLVEVFPALQARLDAPLALLLLDATVGIAAVALESVVLAVAGIAVLAVLTVLFDVLVATVAGAHAASARMLMVITRLKIFFRFIFFSIC
jgi:hypothetical protein